MTTTGKRIHRIAIERATTTTDDYGGEIEAWATHTEAFAEVLFGSGQERREAAQESAAQTATFIVPWTPKLGAVTVKDHILAMGGTWDITSSVTIGQNKEQHITGVRSV
jgi:SPP1 family predicted phage head-tail adaptor